MAAPGKIKGRKKQDVCDDEQVVQQQAGDLTETRKYQKINHSFINYKIASYRFKNIILSEIKEKMLGVPARRALSVLC